jgi:hypothetical protein
MGAEGRLAAVHFMVLEIEARLSLLLSVERWPTCSDWRIRKDLSSVRKGSTCVTKVCYARLRPAQVFMCIHNRWKGYCVCTRRLFGKSELADAVPCWADVTHVAAARFF